MSSPRPKPEHSQVVADHLAKAMEACIAAVTNYNRPDAAFRTRTYTILMIVAWTAMFHAIFHRRGKKPWYVADDSGPVVKYQEIDGEPLSRGEFRALLMAYRNERVDNVRLRAAMGLDTLGASQLLRGLRDRELLTLHSHGAASYYTLSPTLREHIGESSGADRGEFGADRGEFGADWGELGADRGELEDRIDATLARIEGSSGADRGELPAAVSTGTSSCR